MTTPHPTPAELRAQVAAAREPAMRAFEASWGTRDVGAVMAALRQAVPASTSPADAARKARAMVAA